MATAVLPDLLRTKLEQLSRRLQRLRLLRGLSWVVLALVGGAASAVALDYWLELPPVARVFLAIGWLAVTAWTTWRGLLRPLNQPLSAASLAAAVEEEYPRLKERLSSSVELSESTDDYHGSRAFVRLLVRETDLKTRALDFRRAAPPHRAEWSAAGAAAALLLLAAPAFLWPNATFGLGRRLLIPWDRRPAYLPYTISVAPGDVFAAKGKPLSITVELAAKSDGVTLPTTCTLTLAPADGKPLRLRMTKGEQSHSFVYRIDEVKSDYRYHVEVGSGETDSYKITVVEPVDLVAGSPIATLTPPAYVKGQPPEKVEGLSDLGIWQFGQVGLECRFSGPADAATLVWTTPGASSERMPLRLGDDRLSARVEMPARTSGTFRLEIDAGHGVLTLPPAQLLVVAVDQPPEYRRVTGLPEKAQIKPTGNLPLTLAVADDLGVASVEVEYRVNDGPVQRESLSLTGLGNTSASGAFTFQVNGKAKEGDVLHVRVRAADTRDVPDAKLGPNVAYYPPGERWAEVRVVAEADPLRQQEVTAKRNEFEKRLREVIEQLSQNQRQLYKLEQEINGRQAGPEEQAESLRRIADAHQALTKNLNEFVAEAVTAGFAPLADKAQAVSDDELRQAGEAVRDAAAQNAQARIAPIRRAEATTSQARDKLEALLRETRDLANSQLDEAKLRDLAQRERELAAKVHEAATPEDRAKLAEQQKQLADELQKLGQDNEAMREAVRAALAEQARKLAAKATDLAQAERAVDEKLRETERRQNAERLADLARQQQQLADDAAKLAEKTKPTAEASRVPPLDPEGAAKAAEALRQGEAADALKQQEQSARELDKTAENLQRAIDVSRDPQEAARQLARQQDETRQRLIGSRANRESLQREEEALRRAIERLTLPANNSAAQREQREASAQAAQAAQKLEQNDTRAATQRMGNVHDALERMAKALPDPKQRLQQARDEVARLQKQQNDVNQQTERATRLGERNDASARQKAAEERADAARKQAEVAERLGKLDAPDQDERRVQAKQASAQATADLLNEKSTDVAASQNEARQTLERLAKSLAGQKTADAKARELAAQQRQLAEEAAQAGDDTSRQADLQRRQERLTREAQNLDPTDAIVRQAEAVQAALQANKALRDRPDDPATDERLKEAADKLQQLADQLAGKENNAERAERLAREQEGVAKQPQPNAVQAQQKTTQIAAEAKQVRADDKAAAEKQQALDALAKLQNTPPNADNRGDAEQAAAQSLRRLADKLADNQARQPSEAQPPSARDLAEQQRKAAQQTDAARRQSGANQAQALQQAAADQQKLQEQTAKLSVESAPQAMQQARQAMDRAAQALAKNDAAKAAQEQHQAAEALEKAASQGERAEESARQQRGEGQPNAEQVNQARSLAQQQRELRDQVRQVVGQPGDQSGDANAAQALQQQQQVARDAGELAKGLGQAAGQMPNERSQDAAREAARNAQQAEKALQQAQNGNNPLQDQAARKQAIDALDKAARESQQASEAASPGAKRASPNGQPPPSDTGDALQEAKGQMNQAQGELKQGQTQQAQGSMQNAAEALDQAAQKMGERNQGDKSGDANRRAESATRPATSAEPGRGDPNSAPLPADAQKYAGKKWGELTGELRTRVLQEMKAQYGDDYARIIKLYFEQIADSNPKK